MFLVGYHGYSLQYVMSADDRTVVTVADDAVLRVWDRTRNTDTDALTGGDSPDENTGVMGFL
jgi:hypothetical protein